MYGVKSGNHIDKIVLQKGYGNVSNAFVRKTESEQNERIDWESLRQGFIVTMRELLVTVESNLKGSL